MDKRTKKIVGSGGSIFNLASVSKQFTAMANMMLKEKGRLELDDEIKLYIPESKTYSGMTIKHLLHHCSGLKYSPISIQKECLAKFITFLKAVDVYSVYLDNV